MRALTRRDFVTRAARLGGAGAAMRAMLALGLLKGTDGAGTPTARAREPIPGGKPSRPTRVLILGAGLAGMATAYELGKLGGYECEIFEARARSGGRCWTVRGGDRETETGDGAPEQRAGFAPGTYFNPGPARIPGHHGTTLGYCREFNIPVEIFNNVNESAFYLVKNLPRVRLREARADLRGYVSEMLAKAVNSDAVDRTMSRDDKEALLEYLRADGGLNPDLAYRPGGSNGKGGLRGNRPGDAFDARGFSYEDLPAAGAHPGTLSDPLDFETVLKAGFGRHLFFERQFDQQPTMFQPVGGMDAIPRAFEARVGDRVRFGAEVREIRRTADGNGVRLIVAEGETLTEVQGDFCVCTLPLSVLRDVPTDFSPPLAEAVRQVPYMAVGKIGLQFKRRFWEQDDRVYGGISWTDQNITQVFYPNYGYLTPGPGVLVGYYHFAGDAEEIGKLPPAERERHALAQGARIHPQYPQEFDGNSFSVAWHRTPHSLGGWATWSEENRARLYPILNRPDGPFYLAGEHLTYLGGWMAGAFESAKAVCAALHERVGQAA